MNTESKAAFGLGVIGIIVAVAALIFSLTARNRLDHERALVVQLQGKLTQLEEQIDALEPLRQSWDRVEGNLRETSATADAAQRQMDRLISQTESALQSLGNRFNQQVQSNRQDLASLANTVRDIERRVGQLEEATPQTRTSGSSSTSTTSTSTSGDNGQTVHRIASGDTYSSLARTYGVTIRAIENANPNVNPNRLQVGQEIIIPVAP